MSRNPDALKRRKILTTSFELFSKKGYKNTKIQDISKAAQIASGTIYTYFTDKEVLFDSTVQEMIWDRLLNQIKVVVESNKSYQEQLQTIAEYAAMTLKKSHTFLEKTYTNRNKRQLLNQNLNACADAIYPIFEKGKKEGFIVMSFDEKIMKQQFLIYLSGMIFLTTLQEGDDVKSYINAIYNSILKVFLKA